MADRPRDERRTTSVQGRAEADLALARGCEGGGGAALEDCGFAAMALSHQVQTACVEGCLQLQRLQDQVFCTLGPTLLRRLAPVMGRQEGVRTYYRPGRRDRCASAAAA